MSNIRLLVISHNSFGQINNMGRTLETTFCQWDSENIAQLYFSDDKPESSFCKKYFRITDFNVAKTLIGKRKVGGVVTQEITPDDNTQKEIDKSSFKQTITKRARTRTPLVYFARNLLWKIGRWKSKELEKWLDEFSPQAVFYASGDYAFSYKVALDICKKRQIPLYISCYDDFYLGGFPTSNALGKYNFKVLMKNVRKAFDYAKGYFCICDTMLEDYKQLFGKDGYVLRTGTSMQQQSNLATNQRNPVVVYAGNLGYGRAEQLVKIGKALKALNIPNFETLHVYSGEIRQELLDMMTLENGIDFHGRVSSDKVTELLNSSMFTIHTESFDKKYIPRTKYSVSTKIADTLASGACMIAFGPLELASINYVSNNNAAFVIDGEACLEEKLQEIINNQKLRENIVNNAVLLARRNHNIENSRRVVFDVINAD